MEPITYSNVIFCFYSHISRHLSFKKNKGPPNHSINSSPSATKQNSGSSPWEYDYLRAHTFKERDDTSPTTPKWYLPSKDSFHVYFTVCYFSIFLIWTLCNYTESWYNFTETWRNHFTLKITLFFLNLILLVQPRPSIFYF